MNVITLDRLIAFGPLLSVSCEWQDLDAHGEPRPDADCKWEVRCWTASGEHTLAKGADHTEAKELALRIGAYFSVPADV